MVLSIGTDRNVQGEMSTMAKQRIHSGGATCRSGSGLASATASLLSSSSQVDANRVDSGSHHACVKLRPTYLSTPQNG